MLLGGFLSCRSHKAVNIKSECPSPSGTRFFYVAWSEAATPAPKILEGWMNRMNGGQGLEPFFKL